MLSTALPSSVTSSSRLGISSGYGSHASTPFVWGAGGAGARGSFGLIVLMVALLCFAYPTNPPTPPPAWQRTASLHRRLLWVGAGELLHILPPPEIEYPPPGPFLRIGKLHLARRTRWVDLPLSDCDRGFVPVRLLPPQLTGHVRWHVL